jgi:hypothetical protein
VNQSKVRIDPPLFGMDQIKDRTASTLVEVKIPPVGMEQTRDETASTLVEMKIPSVETEQAWDSSFSTRIGIDILPRKIVQMERKIHHFLLVADQLGSN